MEKNISQEYIDTICELYNDIYDDRKENTCPPTAGTVLVKTGCQVSARSINLYQPFN